MSDFELTEDELSNLLKMSMSDNMSVGFTDNLMDKIEYSFDRKEVFKTVISKKPAILILIHFLSIIVISLFYKFAEAVQIYIAVNFATVISILLFIVSVSFVVFIVFDKTITTKKELDYSF